MIGTQVLLYLQLTGFGDCSYVSSGQDGNGDSPSTDCLLICCRVQESMAVGS